MKDKKKILVTGADGFIGSHLTEKLVDLGYKVKAFVYYNSFNSYGWLDTVDKDILQNLEIFSGDVRDPYGVKQAVKGCDVILHLAALIGIPFSYHSPDSYVDTNVKGTLNILNAGKELGVEKIVVTSTSEVYGTALYVPIDEKHPLQGQSPYSASKIAADQLSLSFYRSFDTPVTIIRPFNTYGPRQSARAIIPTIITQIASGVKDIKIGNINPTRDFSFVYDVVQGFVNITEAENVLGEVINIGSNNEISVGELANLIKDIMGGEVNIISDEKRLRPKKSEVQRLWADNTKAKNLLGFKPCYSLRDGLKETINWFTNKENLKTYKTEIYNI